MPKEVFGRDYRFLERRELLTFEEIDRLARSFVASGVEKIRITGGEPLVRRDLERLVASARGDSASLDLTLTTNGALLPQKARSAEGRRPRRVSRSASTRSTTRSSRAMNDVDFPVQQRARGNRRRCRRGPAGEGEHGRQARRERGQRPADGAPLPRTRATFCASSSTWTSATRTAGGSTMSCRPPRSSRRSTRELPLEPVEPELPGRGRPALALPRRRRRDRRDRLRHPAVLRRLHARAPLRRGQAVHVPVRPARARPARAVRGGASDEELRRELGRIWGARTDRYSEIRSANTVGLPKVEMSYIGG